MSWPKKVYSRSMVPVYTDTNDANMLFRYSGQQRGGKYLDASGNGNNSTSIIQTNSRNKAIGFASTLASVSSPIFGSALNPASQSMSMFGLIDVKVIAVTGNIFGKGCTGALSGPAGGIQIGTTGLIRVVWWDGAAYRSVLYLNYNSSKKHYVGYVFDYANNKSILYIDGVNYGEYSPLLVASGYVAEPYKVGYFGGDGATAQGSVKDPTLWSRALTAADVRTEWLQYAQMVQFKTGWGAKESIANENTVGNFVGNGSTPFEILSGTWKISLKTVDGEIHKVLECVAPGTAWLDRKFLAINSTEAAYGSWRGLAYHAPSATPTIIAITATAKGDTSTTTGYCIRGYNQEARLTRYAAGVFTDRITTPAPGALISMPEFHYARDFQGNWRANLRLAPGAYGNTWTNWQSSITVTDTTYTTSEGMSFTGNVGDWLSLGTLRDNFALTKFLGEFVPSEV